MFGYTGVALMCGAALHLTAGNTGTTHAALVLAATSVGLVAGGRALVCTANALVRWRLSRRAKDYAIQIDADTIRLCTPTRSWQIGLGQLIGAHLDMRSSVPRLHLAACTPEGRFRVDVPAVFERPQSLLAELRQAAATGAGAQGALHSAELVPSSQADLAYAAASAGDVPHGAVPIQHGWGWLVGLPFGALATGTGMFFAGHVVGLPEGVSFALRLAGPILGLGGPLWWLIAEGREVAVRAGLSILLAPDAFLYRAGRSASRVPWTTVTGTRIESYPLWNVPRGFHRRRTLVWERSGQPDVRYVETFLGAPAEVVQLWTDHYILQNHATPTRH